MDEAKDHIQLKGWSRFREVGFISFLTSLAGSIIFLPMVLIGTLLEPLLVDNQTIISIWTMIAPFGYVGLILIYLGFFLGIAGLLFQRKMRRIFAVSGIIISVSAWLVTPLL